MLNVQSLVTVDLRDELRCILVNAETSSDIESYRKDSTNSTERGEAEHKEGTDRLHGS